MRVLYKKLFVVDSTRNCVKWTFQKLNSSTAVHTLRVAEQIKQKRERALLGGGQERINVQHKKVY